MTRLYRVKQNRGQNQSDSIIVTVDPETVKKLGLKAGDSVAWDGDRLRKAKVTFQ